MMMKRNRLLRRGKVKEKRQRGSGIAAGGND